MSNNQATAQKILRIGGRRWRDSLTSFILALRMPHLRKSLLPHPRQQAGFWPLPPRPQAWLSTPPLQWTFQWLLNTIRHCCLVSAAGRWHPPPHVRPKGFTGGKGCNRENRENREQQRKRRAESRAFQTLIPPARWSVRPPSRCWCRKGSY